MQEFKSSRFITLIAMNTIAPDYLTVISKADARKGGMALLHHPSLPLIASGTILHGCVSWAQLQFDATIISITFSYAHDDSLRARALFWHKLKGELLDG